MAMNGQLQFGAGMAVVGTIAFIVGLLWMSTALGDLGDSVDSLDYNPSDGTTADGDFGFFACFGGMFLTAFGTYALFFSLIPLISGGMQGVNVSNKTPFNATAANVLLGCPHCNQEIQLPPGASGLFECPGCQGEFEWN
jgi:hypothetical protein